MNKLLSFSFVIILFFLSSCERIGIRKKNIEKWKFDSCYSEFTRSSCSDENQSSESYYYIFNSNGSYEINNEKGKKINKGTFTITQNDNGTLSYNIGKSNDFFGPFIVQKSDTLKVSYGGGFAGLYVISTYIRAD